MDQATIDAAGITAFLLVSNMLGELENRGLLSNDQAVDLVDRTQLSVEKHFHDRPDAKDVMDACHQQLEELMRIMRLS